MDTTIVVDADEPYGVPGPVHLAHYAIHDPVPPPSKADAEAEARRLEDLKARLIAAGGCH